MIQRNPLNAAVSHSEPLHQASFTAMKGIDATKAITVPNVVNELTNLDVNDDGSVSIRKPLIFRRTFDAEVVAADTTLSLKCVNVIPLYTSEHVFILYEQGGTSFPKYWMSVESTRTTAESLRMELWYEDTYTYDVYKRDWETLPSSVACSSDSKRFYYAIHNDFINFTNVSAVHTATATILGNCTVDLTNATVFSKPDTTGDSVVYDSKLLDIDYAKKAPRYMHVYRDAFRSNVFVLRVKTPEVNTLEKSSELPFKPNLVLDNPYAIRDEYDSSYVDITGVLMYTPTSLNAQNTPEYESTEMVSEQITDRQLNSTTPCLAIHSMPVPINATGTGKIFNFATYGESGAVYASALPKRVEIDVHTAKCKAKYINYNTYDAYGTDYGFKTIDVDLVASGKLAPTLHYISDGVNKMSLTRGILSLSEFRNADIKGPKYNEDYLSPIIDKYAEDMKTAKSHTKYCTNDQFYVECCETLASTYLLDMLDTDSTGDNNPVPTCPYWGHPTEARSKIRYVAANGTFDTSIQRTEPSSRTSWDPYCTYGTCVLYNPELTYSMRLIFENIEDNEIVVDLGTYTHKCVNDSNSDFTIRPGLLTNGTSGTLTGGLTGFYYYNPMSITVKRVSTDFTFERNPVSRNYSAPSTAAYLSTATLSSDKVYSIVHTHRLTNSVLNGTDVELRREYTIDAETFEKIGLLYVVKTFATIRIVSMPEGSTFSVNNTWEVERTGETLYNAGTLTTYPFEISNSGDSVVAMHLSLPQNSRITYERYDGLSIASRINATADVIQNARVSDLTESNTSTKFSLANTAVLTSENLKSGTRVLKAFMKLPSKDQFEYYGFWEYTMDGVEWHNVYSVDSISNMLHIRTPKTTLDDSLDSDLKVSERYLVRYAHSMREISGPTDRLVSDATASDTVSRIVLRPDCLFLTSDSNVYGTDPNLTSKNTTFRFTVCTASDLYTVKKEVTTVADGNTITISKTLFTYFELPSEFEDLDFTNEDTFITVENEAQYTTTTTVTFHGFCVKNTIAQQVYSPHIGTHWEFAHAELPNAVYGDKFYYGNRIYSYNNPKFLNNVIVSDPGSFITPLLNVAELHTTGTAYVTQVVPWRNYTAVFTEDSAHLLSAAENGFYVKTVSNAAGVSELDGDTCKAIYNGIIFKSGSKIFTLYPNASAGDDSILNLNDVSSPVSHLIDDLHDHGKCFALYTERDYYIFIPFSNRTVVFKYAFNRRIWTRFVYEGVSFKTYVMYSVDDIRMFGTHNGVYTEFYFDNTLENVYPEFTKGWEIEYIDNVPYGDFLTADSLKPTSTPDVDVPSPQPIEFKLDSGQRTDNLSLTKKFSESKFLLATLNSNAAAKINVEVYVDGNPYKIRLKGDGIVYKDEPEQILTLGESVQSKDSDARNTVSQVFLRYSGKGKTIRHVITGSSLYNFKLYEVFYRYRPMPNKQ